MTVLICTTENSGIDRYSQELAKLLPVTTVRTGRYKLELDGYWLVNHLKTLDDTVHYTNQHFGRISMCAGLPFIVTVHDLERICFPFSNQEPQEEASLKTDAAAIQKAEHVIAVSENTKKDLMRFLKIPDEKITVVYNGVNHEVFKPNAHSISLSTYILYVGSERPRKNLERLLEAFVLLKKSPDFADLKLIKVGSAGRSDAFRQTTLRKIKELGLEREVIFIDQITDDRLVEYYSSARALVYPSLYEGFGLPVLEAMACGCPVITSNVSSLPEVAGDAAFLINPYDVRDICGAIARLLTDGSLRKEMAVKGKERSKIFSWEKTAEQTMSLYRQVEQSVKGRQKDSPNSQSSGGEYQSCQPLKTQ
ncbi:MAG TPA: glycosyltransferase family 1 protein [Dehalococcoidales bacterium]